MKHLSRPAFGLGQIAVLCMIPDPELRALQDVFSSNGATVLALPSGFPGEHRWELDIDGFRTQIVLRRIAGQGNTEAAIETLGVLYRQAPRFVFLCGIAGGMQLKKCRLGDVVIASDVEYRGFNKVSPAEGSEEPRFRPVSLATGARPGGKVLIDRFFGSGQRELPSAGPGTFRTVFEKILAWDLVLDHLPTKERLLSEVDGTIVGVEMEAGGFLKAIGTSCSRIRAVVSKVS